MRREDERQLGAMDRTLDEVGERLDGALGDGDEFRCRKDLDGGDERARSTTDDDVSGVVEPAGSRDEKRDRIDHGPDSGVKGGLGVSTEPGGRNRGPEECRPCETVSTRPLGDPVESDEHPGESRRRLEDVEMDCLRTQVAAEAECGAADHRWEGAEAVEPQERIHADRGGSERRGLDGHPGGERGKDDESEDVRKGDRSVRRGEKWGAAPRERVVEGKVPVTKDLADEDANG